MRKMACFLALVLIAATAPAFGQAPGPEGAGDFKIFQSGYVEVTGESATGQTEYNAVRAAKLVAQREILEVLQGLRLYGDTTVKDGMLVSEVIQTKVRGFLRGAFECGKQYFPDKGYARVCLRLRLASMFGVLPDLQEQGMRPEPKPTFQPAPDLVKRVLFDSGKGRPAAGTVLNQGAYDGVIVDVQSYGFKPALENRILTDQQDVLFDHSKVASQILIERGASGYAADINKAKALLQDWGSRQPMVIKGRGVINITDAEVATADATKIYYYDRRSNMLAQGRVVFLIK